MKKLLSFTFSLLFFNTLLIAQFDHFNMAAYSNWFDPNATGTSSIGSQYSSCWGFRNPDNKEYAILGGANGTYFIEVTIPDNPQLRDYVPGFLNNCIWREYKTYQNYAYMVSDDGNDNRFQIVDVSFLPDSVHLVHNSDSILVKSHTIYVDNGLLYGGSVLRKNNVYHSLAVFDLTQTPEKPQFLRALNDDFPFITTVHDMFVRNDTVYASCGYQGFYVFKYNRTINQFTLIGNLTSYPDAGYNHSSWITPNGKTMVFADEVPNDLALKIINVEDLGDIQVKSTFKSNGATPHNPYILNDQTLVMSYYEDGIRMYNISDPQNPQLTGYFDTYPQNGSTYGSYAYKGCWGAYPFLPSGILLASDMQNGLFVLKMDEALNVSKNEKHQLKTFPNPANNYFNIITESAFGKNALLFITDMSGKKVYENQLNIQSDVTRVEIGESLSTGIYLINLTIEGKNKIGKLIIE